MADSQVRIKESAQHHRHRPAEIIGIPGTGSYNAFQTAARMSWDIKCETWGSSR